MQTNNAEKLSDRRYRFISENGISVVNFYVSWSFYSKIQKLILNKFQQILGSKVKIYNINADRDRTLVEKFNITSYPTIIVFKDGKNVIHLTGLQDNETLLLEVKKYIEQDEFTYN